MGTSSSNKNNNKRESFYNENGCIIWIDRNVDNEENKIYLSILKKNNFQIFAFKDVEWGFRKIFDRNTNFKNIYVILSGFFYRDFILKFKEHLKDICVVPKIAVFTSDKELFLEKNSNIKDIIENKFYILGGIQTLFEGIYEDFLKRKLWKQNYKIEHKCLNSDLEGEQYTFEYINNELELFLPFFYKFLMESNEKNIYDELTHYLYETYKENNYIEDLLEPIDGIPDIPIEILCKYYARLFTIESNFYLDINKSLRLLKKEELFSNNYNNYSFTYIKSFYEGIRLHCFNVNLREKLYRFSCLAQKEIDKINEYLKYKKPGIPGIFFLSRPFLSFYENEKIANHF